MPTPSHPIPSPPDGSGLVLRPFRGVRYAPGRVDLAAVTSPPYDMVGPDDAERLESLEPHNVVRLVLPDRQAREPDLRYRRAASLLRQWLVDQVLDRDDEPALYVYEESDDHHLQRGLMGAVELRAPEEGVVLPHEGVNPGPVADRLAQMRATGANLEPIYLLAAGTGTAGEVVDEVATSRPPLVSARTDDGATHRLWAVAEPEPLRAVATALRGRQALIADGHHRYATYLRLQQAHRAAGRGPGPWDAGLAMLVDSQAYPPRLQAIHRVLPGVSPTAFLDALPPGSAVRSLDLDLPEALSALAAEPEPDAHPYIVTGDGGFRLVSVPAAAVADRLPPGHTAAWRALDVSVLHHGVLAALPLRQEDVVFVPEPAAAVRQAEESRGTAVLLVPPTVRDVLDVAAAADRMPPKSTSYGPKPRNGLVLRLLDGRDW